MATTTHTGEGHIILIGMPGSGKSKLGSLLADKTSLPFYELDAEIQRSAGKTIRAMFAEDDEKLFRDTESKMLAEVMRKPGGVVSCGGGIILREHNCQLLKEHSKCIIYLNASKSLLIRRLAQDEKRPLLDVPRESDRRERILELLRDRDSLYRAVANKVFDINEETDPDESTMRLLKLVGSDPQQQTA